MRDNLIRFSVPRTFRLFAQTFIVHKCPTLIRDRGKFGEFLHDGNTILVQDESVATNEQMVLSFLHELTHAILDSIGRSDLSENEGFVDLFANAFHQATESAEYEDSEYD